MNPCLSIAVCLQTLYALASSGWYTPEAQQELFRVPIVSRCPDWTYAGCFYPDPPRIGIPARTWADFYAPGAEALLGHEFNHYFDHLYGDISGSPEWAAQSALARSVFGYHKARYSATERYALMGARPWLFPQLRAFYPFLTDAAFVPPD